MADEPSKKETSENFEYVNVDSSSTPGRSGGLGYPTHSQLENAFNALEETLSRGAIGVDVSGVQAGAGNTRITITPSLSIPKKNKRK